MYLTNNNIFSEPIWTTSWQKATGGNVRFSSLSFCKNDMYPVFLKRIRKGFRILDRYVEYPAGELACGVDIKLPEDFMLQILKSDEWDVIDIRHVIERSELVEKFRSVTRGAFFVLKVLPDDRGWELDLPGTFEDYLSMLDSKRRKKYIYYLKRMRSLPGYGFRFLKDDFEEGWKLFLALHRERMKGKAASTLLSDKLYETFYHNIYTAYGREGTLRMASLDIDGRTSAMLFGVEKNGTFYYLNSGFANDISKYSPGIVLPLFCIEYAINAGLRKFNFLIGDDKYKQDMLAQPVRTERILIFRNRFSMMLEDILRRVKEAKMK